MTSPLVAACHSKACAPPPIGKGGSDKGPLASVRPLTNALVKAGGQPFVVGGFVRDKLMGLDSKDIDIEVHGLGADTVARVLSRFGKVDEVGKSFGVLKVSFGGEDLDVSLPRTDSKTGEGHTGFDVSVDPHMGIEAALARRDFTINAIAMTPDGQLVDPFGGARDIKNRRLSAVSDAFSEDPLRVMRGVQFAARFGMTMDERTAKMSRDLLPEIDKLPTERIWGEWEKIGSKGKDFTSLERTLEQVGLQGRWGEVRSRDMDLSGLSGDVRVSTVLAGLGVDPVAIGAPNAITNKISDMRRAAAFTGSDADSRAFARTLKHSSFSEAARINPSLRFDPAVAAGPTKVLVSGKDLTSAGMKPGPEMGQALKRIAEAQDAGRITTPEEALRLVALRP